MKQLMIIGAVCVLAVGSVAMADTFAEGTANEFTIDFVTISGDASSANGTYIGDNKPEGFSDPGDYRMGKFEITNAQFSKFASNSNVFWTGADVPSHNVFWFEAAQFVNWLNTITGKTAAYKFSGSRFAVWNVTDPGYDASNPLRNSNAKYFLPTENEWVKAAYWNGKRLQTYATIEDTIPMPTVDSNYDCTWWRPLNVGSGSQELNGTYDMMGNVWEWTECTDSGAIRGGAYDTSGGIKLFDRGFAGLNDLYPSLGFRVASVPEPVSFVLLGLGGLALRYRKW